MQLSKEQRGAWIQDVLDKAFLNAGLTPDDVTGINVQNDLVPFPRSFYCNCRRCTSQYKEWSVLGSTITLETAKGVMVGWLPGPKDEFAHPQEGE
jgi:hypothetical protein